MFHGTNHDPFIRATKNIYKYKKYRYNIGIKERIKYLYKTQQINSYILKKHNT